MSSTKQVLSGLLTVLCITTCFDIAIQATACSPNPGLCSEKIVTDKDNGNQVIAGKGSILTVRLKVNLSTGYSWQVVNNTSQLQLIGEPLLEQSEEGVPGKVEHQVFRFEAVTSGSSKLELNYVRPWEKDVPPVKTYRINVHVR